jgi:hypothetical protein
MPKMIEIRITLLENVAEVNELAEHFKDMIHDDQDDYDTLSDVTYEIKEEN